MWFCDATVKKRHLQLEVPYFRGLLGKFNHPGKTYMGCIFELGWGKGKDNPGTFNEARYEFATFAIIPHAGYRWRFSSGFFMNLGGSLGIAYTLKDQKH